MTGVLFSAPPTWVILQTERSDLGDPKDGAVGPVCSCAPPTWMILEMEQSDQHAAAYLGDPKDGMVGPVCSSALPTWMILETERSDRRAALRRLGWHHYQGCPRHPHSHHYNQSEMSTGATKVMIAF